MSNAKVHGLNPFPQPELTDDQDLYVREREEMAATLLMAKRQAALRKYTPLKRGPNKNLAPNGDQITKKARIDGDDANRGNMVVDNTKDDSGWDPFLREREEMAAALLAAKKKAKSTKKGLDKNVNLTECQFIKLPIVGGEEEKKGSTGNESAKPVSDLGPLSIVPPAGAKEQTLLTRDNGKNAIVKKSLCESASANGVENANRQDEIRFGFNARPIRIRLTKEFPQSDIRKILVERARFDLGAKMETLKNTVYKDDSVVDVPDPEFHDFDPDRTRHAFQSEQVWACYDDDDGMPRFYAFVQKILSSKKFKIRFSYLRSPSTAEFGRMSWIRSGFVKTVGHFQVEKKSEIARVENLFSHKVDWERGPHGAIRIFPRCGEVWALYKNWSAEWGPHTPDEVIHEYEAVEILEEYKKDKGCCVVPLVKVNGFRAVFKRVEGALDVVKRVVKREEMFRFSHRVPAFKLDGVRGTDGGPVLDGCCELDPAALPVDLAQGKETSS